MDYCQSTRYVPQEAGVLIAPVFLTPLRSSRRDGNVHWTNYYRAFRYEDMVAGDNVVASIQRFKVLCQTSVASNPQMDVSANTYGN